MSDILILLGLILLNGFFSMAEIALVSARKTRLEAQANKGNPKAKAALKIANRPDIFLSTVQIGITIIGIFIGIYSEEKIIETNVKAIIEEINESNDFINSICKVFNNIVSN